VLKRNWKIIFVGISQLADILSMFAAAGLVFLVEYLWQFRVSTSQSNFVIGFTIFAVSYITIAVMLGLYRGSFHLSLSLQNLIIMRAFIVTVLVTLTIIGLIPNLTIDRRSLLIFLLSLPFLFFFERMLLRRLNLFFQGLGFGVHNSLIVGYDGEALKIFQRFSSFPELGYKIKGYVVKEKNPASLHQPQYFFNQFEELLTEEKVDRVFIPSAEIAANGYGALMKVSEKRGIKLKILSPHAEELLKIARIYDIAGITLTSPPRYHVDAVKLFVKRIFDIVLASIAILLFSPLFLLTIVSIYFESGRPIFFLQKRSSLKGGKVFNFIKFRSMVDNADQLKEELLERNESDGALFKMKDDPRITRIGRFIRKLSIDELPQLFNVLIGDMSLVGPRPLPLTDLESLDESDDFWETIRDRAAVKPGMTGLWQISGRSEIRFPEMILLDLYYVENHSLMFDLEIIFETIPVVLFGRGAY
jgi:exopolysaccharide biosynthesis polyprenyl glycosylphosphotransferase